MKIATWNINSVRARTDRLLTWLGSTRPDVLCLQELKCTEDQFPRIELEAKGYACHVFGQKTYNGVALLSRLPVSDVRLGFEDGIDDGQARVISGTVGGVRVVGLYAPNGQEVESQAYQHKLEWYGRLKAWLVKHHTKDTPLLVCGDFNVIPDDADVWDPQLFANQTLFTPAERRALKDTAAALELVDLYRARHPEPGRYTFWDYQALCFPKNHGLRIDHFFVTAPIAARCVSIEVDREARKGQKPSDHAPVVLEVGG